MCQRSLWSDGGYRIFKEVRKKENVAVSSVGFTYWKAAVRLRPEEKSEAGAFSDCGLCKSGASGCHPDLRGHLRQIGPFRRGLRDVRPLPGGAVGNPSPDSGARHRGQSRFPGAAGPGETGAGRFVLMVGRKTESDAAEIRPGKSPALLERAVAVSRPLPGGRQAGDIQQPCGAQHKALCDGPEELAVCQHPGGSPGQRCDLQPH